MEKLDILRAEGLSPSVSDLDHPTPAVVLGAQVAPYIEDLFRWNKHSFGSKNFSKEMQATVCYMLPYGLYLDLYILSVTVTL